MKYPPRRVIEAVRRRTQPVAKSLWQLVSLDQKVPKRLAFVLGCQRSGTSMLVRALGQSAFVVGYAETDHPVMCDFRLADESVIRRVLERSPAQVVAVKPICDSQWADRLLATYENSRALWLYRDYRDVINSSLREFSGQLMRLQQLADGQWARLGWRVERCQPDEDDIEFARQCYRDGAKREDAAAISWYLRTRLYEKHGFCQHPLIRLVKYEKLVSSPRETMGEISDFLGIPFEEGSIRSIHGASLGKHPPATLMPPVEEACRALQVRMDALAEYQANLTSPV